MTVRRSLALCAIVLVLTLAGAACDNSSFYGALGNKVASTKSADYSVTSVTNTGGVIAGAALAGNFVLSNVGSANGSKIISWQVYASTSPTPGGGTLVASGTTAPLNAQQSSSPISFAGTWPSTAGVNYLIVQIAAADDNNTANNALASGAVTLNPANVDYQVLSVTCTGGSPIPAGAVNGNIQIKNNGPNNGTQPVTWQIYASTNNTLNTSGTLIASGSTPALGNGASSSLITFSSAWPLTYGAYYLKAKVSVTADVDTNSANDINVTGSATSVGIIPEVELNDDPAFVTSSPTPLGVSFQPGMSVKVTGSMNTSDPYDIFAFDTGTATSITFSLSWGPSANATMYVFTAPSTSTIAAQTAAATTSLSMLWTVDSATTTRWIAIRNGVSPTYTGNNLGGWTLIITGN